MTDKPNRNCTNKFDKTLELISCKQVFVHTKIFHVSHTRKAISDVITTLLLLAITIVGGVMIFSIFQSTTVTENIKVEPVVTSDTESAILVGYDTRDSTDLLKIGSVDNAISATNKLCVRTCSPSTATEFIALILRNDGVDTIFIDSITVNEVRHTWETCVSSCSITTAQGKFSIVTLEFNDSLADPSALATATVRNTQEVVPSQQVGIIIRLSNEINAGTTTDISLNESLRIFINTFGSEPIKFTIPAGSTR